MSRDLELQAVMEGLGQPALIFDNGNHLVLVNQAARAFLGADIRLIRTQGWDAAAGYFDRFLPEGGDTLDVIRTRALMGERAERFHLYRSGELIPCWAAAVNGKAGEIFTLLTLELPDWTAFDSILGRYLQEVDEAISATSGHADLILKSAAKPGQNSEQLARRISGFARLISVHMYRLNALTNMTTRLHSIRTGRIREQVINDRRQIILTDFFEDFMETLEETPLIDPETQTDGYRARIKRIVPPHLSINASPHYLSLALRDILRNAIMYSMRGTPIKIVAFAGRRESTVQIDLTDEGYGVRTSEVERVFAPFERARQPQIISEFGYGLSLYLCRYEIEAMNGQLWFESQEGSGTTFSLRLPAWREEHADDRSSSPV
jgi:signal transduction histidine kinase